MTRIRPKVSILLPAFNAVGYLQSAIESCLRQTYLNFELLIVDDGSTDGSTELIARHARTDSRVRAIARPNTGLVVALEELRAMARGELIARMDADDIALPNRLEAQIARFESDPDLVCLGGAVEFIDGDARVLLRPAPVTGNDEVQREALGGRTPICHPASMFRADAVERVGGYHDDAYPSEDLDLFLRLGEIGTLDNVPDTILQYRVHAHSISVTKRRHQLDKMRQACERAWARRGMSDGVFAPNTDGAPSWEAKLDPALAEVVLNPTACALASRGLSQTLNP